MNFGEAPSKISKIVNTVKTNITNIENIKTNTVDKINGYIDDLEKIINNTDNKSEHYVEIQKEKKLKEINDGVDGLQNKLTKKINDLSEWYNKQVNNAKKCIIKANFAKLGQTCSDDMAETLASTIPHPEFSSFVPKIDLKLELPNLSNLKNTGYIKLPRLEI